MRYQGKRVLVTGGATGIGRATALGFAREGAAVMIGDVDERAAETVSMIEATGGKAAFVRCDVASLAQVDELVAACVETFGGLEAAFNNAGMLMPTKPLHEMAEADYDRTLAVNLKGIFNALRAEIGYMLDHGGGAIVNTASVGGVIADPNMSPYIASKHGVVGLTKAAAIDYARKNIRVNAIAPGFVQTPMTQMWVDDPAFCEAFFAGSPIGRFAQPEEMVGLVLHLCSDEASFTNGALFVMDGGQTAH